MHDNSITLEGLKKLSDTEKLFNPLIRNAVDRLTLFSDKWNSLISNAKNSENISEDEVKEIIDTLKELINAQKNADKIIKEYHDAQISVTENIKSDIMQAVSLNPDDIASRIKDEALNAKSTSDISQLPSKVLDSEISSLIHIMLSTNLPATDLYTKEAQDNLNAIDTLIEKKKKEIMQWLLSLGQKGEQIINATTTRASSYTFGTTKVEGLAFDPERNPAIYSALVPVRIDVSRRKSQRKKIETLFYIDFKELKQRGVSIDYEYLLTPYDREIHNAVATLASAGNEYINPSMIFQLLSGNTGTTNDMSPETRKSILRSIDIMMATLVTIDASAEISSKMITKTTGIYKGALIPAERVEIMELNGQKVTDCIHLLRTPPLYDYARDKNQIGTIDIKMLDTPLSNTKENIELKGYLLKRIASIKNAKSNMSDTIRYDTLYKYLQIKAPNKNALYRQFQDVRNKVKKLLDFWIKMGLISSYEEEKEGKSIAKVTISI